MSESYSFEKQKAEKLDRLDEATEEIKILIQNKLDNNLGDQIDEFPIDELTEEIKEMLEDKILCEAKL